MCPFWSECGIPGAGRCAKSRYGGKPSLGTCYLACEEMWEGKEKEAKSLRVPSLIEPIPRAEWPLWAKTLALLATPADKGVGDTIARTIGPVGGDAFKAWYKRLTGKDCGCGERQDALNQRYPYASSRRDEAEEANGN